MLTSSPATLALLAFTMALAFPSAVLVQSGGSPPLSLDAFIHAEQALLARTTAVGWNTALPEFAAVTGTIVARRDPGRGAATEAEADVPVWWDPRAGDVARSGELGFVMGPARMRKAGNPPARETSATFLRVWKRQTDGTLRIVTQISTPTPGPASFPQGFSSPAHDDRFSGDYTEDTPPLSAADGVLNSGLRTNQTRAYRAVLTPGSRLFRPDATPLDTPQRIARWLASQPAMTGSDTHYADAARSGDLGYTWGTYRVAARRRGATATPAAAPAPGGMYLRIWIRNRAGQWRVAVDATRSLALGANP